MIFFNVSQNFRIFKEDIKKVEAIVKKNRGIYENKSHFYRVAVLKLIREHNKGVKIND